MAFGVPKGAVIGGRPASHANVFACKWRKVARVFVPEGGYLMWGSEPLEVRARTRCGEWCQFRLTEDEDDLEVLQPPQELRQVGYEEGEAICELGPARMTPGYVQPVPFNPEASEWADVNSFGLHIQSTSRASEGTTPASYVSPMRYRFNPGRGLYEWVQTGPKIGPGLFEGNISPYGSDWVIAARREGREPGVAWTRVNDPFGEIGQVVIPEDVRSSHAPLSAYRCPDGVTRLCTGDATVSPHRSNRDPIYLWDIDPDDRFRASNRRKIYSPREDGNPIPVDHNPLADMVKLLPHAGKRRHSSTGCVRARWP